MPHLSKLKGCSHASNHRSRSEAAGRPSGVGSPVGVLLPHRGPHNAWTYFRGQPRIQPSIGTVGDAYDNSLMESIIGLFKTEAIRTEVFHEGPYRKLSDVEFATAGWVDWWNNQRLHSSIGHLTPIEYEQLHYAALEAEPNLI
ncbi:hypothetical protein GCM10011401_14980 [Nesterenkonia cremea]|uniref:Integrase catalytic domain-containing protein n=1 Tax=Nesterenkonia cremea TaxID=1882340 RepID=A0A917EQZ8_9MICC|nr:hypothetical protein GCM10011401_14980 [Nesterenkonia cremea]